MLLNEDTHIVKNLDKDWDAAVFVKDRSNEGILEGRPSKGVAIMWNCKFTPYIKPVYFNESFIGIELLAENKKLFMLNIYMPYDDGSIDAMHKYCNSLSIIKVLIEESKANCIVLIGDFNANYGIGRLGKRLNEFLIENDLLKADSALPKDTFTYLSPGHNSTSWLDHIICSVSLNNDVTNIEVDYELCLFDHFPVIFNIKNLQFAVSADFVADIDLDKKFVYWNKMTKAEFALYKSKVYEALNVNYFCDNDIFLCNTVNCHDPEHMVALDKYLTSLTNALHLSSHPFTVNNKLVKKCIPGWNQIIKPYFENAHKEFLIWKDNGKPRSGSLLDNMKVSRSLFKNILKECRCNEESIRNERMMQSLKNKNVNKFWSSVRTAKNAKLDLPASIDNITDQRGIANKFSNMFSEVLSKADPMPNSSLNFNNLYERVPLGEILYTFKTEDIRNAIGELNPCIGPDFIHAFHLVNAPDLIHSILSKFLNSCLLHGYLPPQITDGVINPLVKNKTGNLHDSANYRPIIGSSIFLKIYEYCYLRKIEGFLSFNDRQHGFRAKYSTGTAALTLKETVGDYINRGSNVYACFVDLSKAFDNVCHNILFKKLHDAGVPVKFCRSLLYLYSNQKIKVKFKNALSESWHIKRGVRQGGILSPLLFNCYVDQIITAISKKKVGCKLGLATSNIIAYADDLVLLSPSREGLQNLLNFAYTEISKLNLSVNEGKTSCMIFNSNKNNVNGAKFHWNGKGLSVVKTIKYLGFVITDDLSNKQDMTRARNCFYNSFNGILRSFSSLDPEAFFVLFRA
ncbi:unnamed protein product [Rotaria socialis]|nr:unnamed protein product [Rotaria socialis]